MPRRASAKQRHVARCCCIASLAPSPLTSRLHRQAADDADEEEDEFADDEEEEEEEAELKHDPKRLATLAKRGVQLNLKEGVSVAKGKKPAAAKGKAAAPAKGKAKK
jgi:hypothetical protein